MNAMDHRIAERRHEVTEERARGRLRWLIWLVLLVVAVLARAGVLHGLSLTGFGRQKRTTIRALRR